MSFEGCTIVYNGEVFNAAELRSELEAAGHRFLTRCDTEVVLHGYVAWGADVLRRMNGMWALAIWDARRRRLFLARDRLGVKPLVYARTDAGLVFASELKALVASGIVARELDVAALPHFLSSFTAPEPHTFVRGVRRLPAAHTLTVDPEGTREQAWWDCALPEEEDRGAEPTARRSRTCSPTPSAGAWSATSRSASCCRAASTRDWSRPSRRRPPAPACGRSRSGSTRPDRTNAPPRVRWRVR